jgi:hypothetical protein
MFGKRGIEVASWKGGRGIMKSGYIRVWVGDGERKYEHRNVFEKILGRSLKRNEVVHHKNGDKKDNRIENLEIMSQSKHVGLHKPRLGKKLKKYDETSCSCRSSGLRRSGIRRFASQEV